VLLWVTLSAFADRYDHEYCWGVSFAAWCWHVLGVVWLAILFVFAMAFAV
jgi:heme/copper-type cytochrome/quinol oxidase subunit 3